MSSGIEEGVDAMTKSLVMRCKQKVYLCPSYKVTACKRNAWKDGYCKQHHPDTVAERRRIRDAKWKKESESRRAKYERETRAMEIMRKIEAGTHELVEVRREK